MSSPGPTISVAICCYTLERWDDLRACVASIYAQTLQPAEIVVVVDHNPELLARATSQFPRVRVVESTGTPGISAARTTAVATAAGDIVAFIDDDARAEPDWLEHMIIHYADPNVMGVGGFIEPAWDEGRPPWFPREFDWVVGCSFLGMPTAVSPVRNLIAANMSTRRDAMLEAGDFREDVGRLKRVPVGCEETEMCIRIAQRRPGSVFLHDPAVHVHHRVRAARSRPSYFFSRCYGEGISKARVASAVGSQDGLSWERRHATRTLPAGFFRELWAGLTLRDPWGFARAGAIATGLVTTALGYALGKMTPPATTADGPSEAGRRKAS